MSTSYKTSLRSQLKRKNPELEARLGKIHEIAEKVLVFTHSKFPYFTNHDITHSDRVETCLNWLIRDEIKEKLDPYELFFLIVSAWLHDYGMVGSEEEDPSKIREDHHLRVEEKIIKYHKDFFLEKGEAIIIGRISKGHRKIDLNSTEYDDVNFGQGHLIKQRFLAALLRLADEFEITSERVSEIIFYELKPGSKAAEEYKKHLSIIGIGYDPFINTKVVFHAIVEDEPELAELVEQLGKKINNTLNDIKTILAINGYQLDSIECRIDARNFIYEPLKFHIREEKIVELLIGQHLYKEKDVAIRELLQNAVDACKRKQAKKSNYEPKIIMEKSDPKTLIIEDNGIGMDVQDVHEFFSSLGDSITNIEELKEDQELNLIAKFGIGVLSSFLIADEIIFETKKEGYDPCLFTIYSTKGIWKYQRGSKEESGTKITLILKEEFQQETIEELLMKFIYQLNMPILYKEFEGELKQFNSDYDIDEVIERFGDYYNDERIKKTLLFEINTTNYNIRLYKTSSYDNFLLFNQGFYINNLSKEDFFDIPLSGTFIINLKDSDIINLNISRDNVLNDEKLKKFLDDIYILFAEKLVEVFLSDSNEIYYSFMNNLLGRYFSFLPVSKKMKISELISNKEFLQKIYFPIINNNEVQFLNLKDLSKFKNFIIFNYSRGQRGIKSELRQLTLFKDFFNDKDVVLDSNFVPTLCYKKDNNIKLINFWESVLKYLFKSQPNYKKINNIDLIKQNSITEKIAIQKYLPPNIVFMKIPKEFPEIAIAMENSIIIKKEEDSFSDYVYPYLIDIMKQENNPIEINPDITYIRRGLVFINIENPFIKLLSKIDDKKMKDKNLQSLVQAYILCLLHFKEVSLQNLQFLLEVNICQLLGEEITHSIPNLDPFIEYYYF